jgi:uncharacterized protein (TIGR02996 family)
MDLARGFLDDIIANPEDDAPRLVFADWLSDQGQEDRAEFIRVQVAIANGSATAEMKEREAELLKEHAGAWAEPVIPFAEEVLFRRGFLEGIATENGSGLHEQLPELCRLFPLRLLRLDPGPTDLLATLTSLVADGALSLEALDVSLEADGEGTDWFAELRVLPGAASLRSLLLEHESAQGWDDVLLGLARSPGPLAGLTELGLGFGTVNEPLRAETIEAFLLSDGFPDLTKLHIPFSNIGEEAVARLGESRRWSKLTHLDLGCCHIPLSGWERLAGGPNAARLEWLGLIGGHVDLPEGWDTLRTHEMGQRLRDLLGDRADFDTSATFPRWRGVKL